MPSNVTAMEYIASAFFAAAVLHTFAAKAFNRIARRFRSGSVGENFFHFLGEVEVVFGVWAALLIVVWSMRYGTPAAVDFLESVNYGEALFVFAIMSMAATQPIVASCQRGILSLARLLPLPQTLSLYIVTLIVGPLLGSLITEPAAMTVTALLLKEPFFVRIDSLRFKYATLALLFVNVSLGGTLTHFAAPPVLMVAGAWGWDTPFMLANFGMKVIPAIIIATLATAWYFRNAIKAAPAAPSPNMNMPLWVVAVQMGFMALTIAHSHHAVFFMPLFLFFVGWCAVSQEYQSELKIKESLLVAFFLGGLVTLGSLQGWWLKPLLAQLDPKTMFLGASVLTAFTDNAALTYLGTLVKDLVPAAQLALVAGAVTGGGLTVIANAPNPAGYNLLQHTFGEDGISALYLFLAALPATLLSAAFFFLF